MITQTARTLSLLLVASPLVLSASLAAAVSLGGQWTGNSQVDGDRVVSKTVLSLGAPDEENSTLRIEGRSTCTLKQGKYSVDDAGSGTLSFKDTMGGDACTRLAKGTFTLHPGNTPRQLDFEVKYPGSDGQQVLRRGALSRYP